jgi:hypothetical protein
MIHTIEILSGIGIFSSLVLVVSISSRGDIDTDGLKVKLAAVGALQTLIFSLFLLILKVILNKSV